MNMRGERGYEAVEGKKDVRVRNKAMVEGNTLSLDSRLPLKCSVTLAFPLSLSRSFNVNSPYSDTLGFITFLYSFFYGLSNQAIKVEE